MKKILNIVALIAVICLLTGCHREPPLHLHRGANVVVPMPMINVDLNVYWQYELGYDWEAEWTYGWDDKDLQLFGPIGYTEPKDGFEVRSYYTGQEANAPHTWVKEFYVEDNRLSQCFDFGYYDLLAWSAFPIMDVQSVIINESSLDHIDATTNTTARSRSELHSASTNYQPEQLFAGYDTAMYVSPNLEDYDYYDEETNTYYMNARMDLYPVTYIYLIQVRLHNNNGRINGTSGESNLCGMAKGVTLNTGRAHDAIVNVDYNNKLKLDRVIQQTGEVVDVIGGRCMTFGIPGQNSSTITRAEVNEDSRHELDVNMRFYTGLDSTFTYDVSEQIHKRYRGGVITIDIDVDTLKIPSRPGGGGMDAVIEDFEEEEHEFEIK